MTDTAQATAAATPGTGRFQPADVLRQQLLHDLDLSPDGRVAAYAVRSAASGQAYRSDIHLLDLVTGADVRIHDQPTFDSAPRFSPDGTSLLYLERAEGRARPAIYDIRTRGRRPAADVPGSVASGSVALADWSPDGSRILLVIAGPIPSPDGTAIVVDRLTWRQDGTGALPAYWDLSILTLASGDIRTVTREASAIHRAVWYDENSIICVVDKRPEAALDDLPQAWLFPVDRRKPQLVAQLRGRVTDVAVSENKHIAMAGCDEPGAPIWAPFGVWTVAGDEVRRIGCGLDTALSNVTISDLVDGTNNFAPRIAWASDDEVLALQAVAGRSLPVRLHSDGPVVVIAGGDRVTTHVAGRAGTTAFISAADGGSPDLWVTDGSGTRQMTTEGSAWLPHERPRPQRVTIARSDGPQEAWVLGPGAEKARGLVLHIHGGPYAAHGPVAWSETLTLASAGFTVLTVNPPGSVGYGTSYAQRLAGNWSTGDLRYLVHVLDWAASQGLAGSGGTAVMGLSYGGMAALALLAHDPARYSAAVVENPVAYLPYYQATTDLGTGIGGLGHDPLPYFTPAKLRQSPALSLGRCTPPILLLQAESDLRCPAGQSDLIHHVLHEQGCRVRMVRYPGESHRLFAVGRPDRRADRLTRIRDWFEEHLPTRQAGKSVK